MVHLNAEEFGGRKKAEIPVFFLIFVMHEQAKLVGCGQTAHDFDPFLQFEGSAAALPLFVSTLI